MRLLTRLATAAPAPVLIVAGAGGVAPAWQLALHEDLERVASPRHAMLLVVVGAVPAPHAGPLRRLHDQLVHPRGAVWWTGPSGSEDPEEVLPQVRAVSEDPVGALTRMHRRLLSGREGSAGALGPDDNPTAWRGVGPHGQGGRGMMGGTPYGRGMAMVGEDVRDGLQLDRVPLTLGPLHAALPAGLTLELELQGDVIVTCRAELAGRPRLGTAPEPAVAADPRLLWAADLLRVHGLDGLARRVARTALSGEDEPAGLLARARRGLRPALRGVGEIDGRDALDRLDARLAGGSPAPGALPALLEAHLPGMEWGQAVTTIWTLHRPDGDRS